MFNTLLGAAACLVYPADIQHQEPSEAFNAARRNRFAQTVVDQLMGEVGSNHRKTCLVVGLHGNPSIASMLGSIQMTIDYTPTATVVLEDARRRPALRVNEMQQNVIGGVVE